MLGGNPQVELRPCYMAKGIVYVGLILQPTSIVNEHISSLRGMSLENGRLHSRLLVAPKVVKDSLLRAAYVALTDPYRHGPQERNFNGGLVEELFTAEQGFCSNKAST
eukprot:CAMPEP_0178376890 /NCGR_PEP_ID=MMETSP0689_2-20121128/3636_1 /TAXON_ID=160604 /ORGANISM="Amphidinium massartii, Strain CS-259" /LENGTH=107 /DNA_ID=CAMNT_0019996927 /DNA_START=443 /DNA_END=764 /DNA_ORIENTATION=+